MTTRLVLLAVLLSLVAACEETSSDATLDGNEPMPDGEAALTDPATPAAPDPAAAASDPVPAYVAATTVVRKTKSTESKVDDPANPGKKMSNWVATVYRGEEIVIVAEDGDWCEVKTTGDKTGYAQRAGLLTQDEATLATVLEEAKTFTRPDILTMNASKTVEAGTLLYVTKAKGEFSEANHIGTQSVWLRSDALSQDPGEIAVAKILTQVRYQEGRGKEDNLAKAKQLRELGISTYPDAALTKLLRPAEDSATDGDEAAGEDAPDDGAAPDGAKPAPAADGKAAVPAQAKPPPAVGSAGLKGLIKGKVDADPGTAASSSTP